MTLEEQVISEKRELTDTPDFEIQDTIGDYTIRTKRYEQPGNFKEDKIYKTIIFLRKQRDLPFSPIKTEILTEEIKFRFEEAIELHESYLKQLNTFTN